MFLALLTIKAPPLGWALQTTHQHLLPRVLQKQFALEEPQMPLQQLPLQTQVIEEYFRFSAWFPEKFEICNIHPKTLVGFGDYLEIPNFQAGPGTDGAVGATRICGSFFNSATGQAAHQTLCSFATPFRIGVRFDADEATGDNGENAHGLIENETSISGSGFGYTGFWLDFWQNSC